VRCNRDSHAQVFLDREKFDAMVRTVKNEELTVEPSVLDIIDPVKPRRDARDFLRTILERLDKVQEDELAKAAKIMTTIKENFGTTDVDDEDIEDMVEKMMVETKDCQFLFEDASGLTFMESDTFEQFTMPTDILGDSRPFMTDGMDVKVSVIDGKPISVELPLQVVCEVVETEPVIKGQTVSSSYKPAILDNGVRTTVPPFVGVGDKIVVATADASYVERAK